MCACMCVLCVRDINIQRCRHVLEHTHIHIIMQRLMYVKVWNIMVLNPNVPDLNKHNQTPDVLRKRPCRGSDSWEHIIERRGRHIHSRTRIWTNQNTDTYMCAYTKVQGLGNTCHARSGKYYISGVRTGPKTPLWCASWFKLRWWTKRGLPALGWITRALPGEKYGAV